MFHHVNEVFIENLCLSLPFLMMQGAKAIAEMLKKNSTLRIIELNNNLIDYSVWHYILVYYLLAHFV